MPGAITKPVKRKAAVKSNGAIVATDADVLTLPEAAVYLRVTEDEVLRMVESEQLPGRQFGDSWRFFKPALQLWLGSTRRGRGLLGQCGLLKDDPHQPELLTEIYLRRGRPEQE